MIRSESALNSYPLIWTIKGQDWKCTSRIKNDHEISVDIIKPCELDVYFFYFTRNGNDKITGQRDEFKIFTLVTLAAEEFISKIKPKAIGFTADGTDLNSRIRLYTILAKRIAKNKNYELTITKTPLNSVLFKLIRIDSK